MSETEDLEKTIVILEDALEETDRAFAWLLGFINRDEELRAQLHKVGVSASFLAINHSCGRNDRNVKHLEKSWDELMGPSNEVTLQRFTLTRAYESVEDLGLDQQGHYCAAFDIGLEELYDDFEGVLMYGREHEYYIGCLRDGSYVTVFQDAKTYGPDLEGLEEFLYDAVIKAYNEE